MPCWWQPIPMVMTPLCPPDGVQLHATCVHLPQGAVLLLGPSGSGKSDMALRLIDSGAQLVADDRVNLIARGGLLLARCPEPIMGKIEIRGMGIFTLPHIQDVPVKLAVNLDSSITPERLPDPTFFDCLGLQVSLVSLSAFEGSSCAKIRLFLQYSV